MNRRDQIKVNLLFFWFPMSKQKLIGSFFCILKLKTVNLSKNGSKSWFFMNLHIKKFKFLDNQIDLEQVRPRSVIPVLCSFDLDHQINKILKIEWFNFFWPLHIFKFKFWPLEISNLKLMGSKILFTFDVPPPKLSESNSQFWRILYILKSTSITDTFISTPSNLIKDICTRTWL